MSDKISHERLTKENAAFLGITAVVEDSYGKGDVVLGNCVSCGEKDQLVVIYRGDLNLPEGIKQDDSKLIIKALDEWKGRYGVGFTCGCYAKFHRQVAHIEDRMKRRGS